MAASQELFRCLSRFVDNIYQVLSRSGKDAIEADIKEELTRKTSGKNVISEMRIFQKIFESWDNILKELKNLSVKLEKGEPQDILAATNQLSKAVSSLQLLIAEIVINVGSFVPGPIGIVCSVVLAIGCFAVGDIRGGFMNLVGAIPFAKCAKYLSKIEFVNMIKKCGLEKFNPIDNLFKNLSDIPSIKISNNFVRQCRDVVEKAKNQVAKNAHKSEDKLLGITMRDKVNQLHKMSDNINGKKFGDLLQTSRENPLIPADGLIRGWGSIRFSESFLDPFRPKFGLL